MKITTILNIIGYCFLASAWIVQWTTDTSNEKILRTKLVLAGVGMGVFISAIIVGTFQYFVK